MEYKKKKEEAIAAVQFVFTYGATGAVTGGMTDFFFFFFLEVAKHVWKQAVISELISSTEACFLLSIQRSSLENAMVAVCSFSVIVSDFTLLNVSEQMMNVFLF